MFQHSSMLFFSFLSLRLLSWTLHSLDQAIATEIFIVSKRPSGKRSPPLCNSTGLLHIQEQVLHHLSKLLSSLIHCPSLFGASTWAIQPWPLSFPWVHVEAGYAKRCGNIGTHLVNVGQFRLYSWRYLRFLFYFLCAYIDVTDQNRKGYCAGINKTHISLFLQSWLCHLIK